MPLPDPPELNHFAARASVQAAIFTLPLRDQNWCGSFGEVAGSGIGDSLDFQDHRNCVPGDDPRPINWQACARSGSYSLKLYREKVRPVVEILLDVSESMFADTEKARRIVELFYFAFFPAHRAGASTHVPLLKGPQWTPVERGAVMGHGWTNLALFNQSLAAAPLHRGLPRPLFPVEGRIPPQLRPARPVALPAPL